MASQKAQHVQKTARSEQEISAIMRKVRSRDTAPEVAFRKALWARGVRYHVCPPDLPGKPDIVIPSHQVAIFIDGDFWHGGQWRRRGLTTLEDQFRATTTRGYWLQKIRRNIQRDCRNTAALQRDGWTVLRIWESQVSRDLEACVAMTLRILDDELKPSPRDLVPQMTFLEFFAGIGLMRLGLEQGGWSIAFANDIDEQKRAMYGAHFGDAGDHFVLGDVHTIPIEQIPSATLATASFPCNDLSLAGSRDGLVGKQSSAFWGFMRVLEEMGARRPPLVLLENVPGFLTSHGGRDFEQALLTLNRLGYAVDAFILDAARFVPQSRQRLFVLGAQRGQEETLRIRERAPDYAARGYESDVRPKALANFIAAHPEIAWNIRDLPPQPTLTVGLRDILEDLPHDAPEWWSRERAEYLLNQMSPRHRALAGRMIAGEDWSYGTVFRRMRKGVSMAELRTDNIAGCLRTPRGGSGRQIIFKAGRGEYHVRLLMPREAARLMGAGDYTITASLNQALFGFGDAVCVPVIEWIATHYLNPLVSELLHGYPLH
ncbi:MAG TPA: DNA mismatch endonuclease Vsr [Ktedonobacterales bacterium]